MVLNSQDVIVVSGMHRSGTSAVTSLLPHLGVDLGSDLLAGDTSNPRGYFEDAAMLAFSRHVLASMAPTPPSTGHPDWGWAPDTPTETAVPDSLRDEAHRLIGERRRGRPRWGWKDPRSTLFLDFWAEVIPGARFLLVYRDPWDVQDSMQRLGHPAFLANPRWAHDIWVFYNRRIASFAESHPDRTVLVHSSSLLKAPDPSALLSTLLYPLDNEIPDPSMALPIDEEGLVDRPRTSPLAQLHRLLWPDEIDLLHRLDRAASLPGPTLTHDPPPTLTPPSNTDVPVSVIVTVHDDGDFLAESLASAAEAVPDDSELLIVDDGSTCPETLRILQRLDDAGYRVIRLENSGVSDARNAGIALARGEFVIPLDADNRLGRDIVAGALAALHADLGVGVVYGDRRLFGMEDALRRVPEFDAHRMVEANYIDACAVIRRRAWQSVGGYDPSLPLLEDWEFWLAVDRQGWRFQHLPVVMLEYRVRPNSLLRRPGAEQRALDATEIIQSRYAPLHRSALLARLSEMESSLRAMEGPVDESTIQMERHVDDVTAELEEALVRQRELQTTVEEVEQSRERLIATYEQSRSWRLTRPLRKGMRLIRRT